MAIEKDIEIHGSRGVVNCIEYVDDEDKCTIERSEYIADVDSALSYAQNEAKTHLDESEVILTSGIMCDPKTVSGEFYETAQRYKLSRSPSKRGRGEGGTKTIRDPKTGETKRVAKESIEAHHVIQSFPAVTGLDPKLVHEIGLEYARAAFPNHQCIVSTHMNTDHLHNHIVVCAYEVDRPKKLCMNNKFRYHIRHINDELSLKYGLPILIGNENRTQIHYDVGEKHAKGRTTLFKEELRGDIEKALTKEFVTSWNDFKIYMKSRGYDIKETDKNVTYIRNYTDADGNEKTHRCRDYRLGDRYLRSVICKDKGWEYPGENQQTRYIHHLKDSYKASSSKNDRIFISEKTGRLTLHVDRYDENGRRRTLLEISIIGAIKIILYFWNRHKERMHDTPNPKDRKAVYQDPNDKLATMLEGLEIARTFGIETRDQLKERKGEIGKQISILGRDIFAADAKAVEAVRSYDALDKSTVSPAERVQSEKEMHGLADECARLHLKLDVLKNEYALLSKLSKTLELTKDYRFVLGPGSHLSEYPKCERVNDDTKEDLRRQDRTPVQKQRPVIS